MNEFLAALGHLGATILNNFTQHVATAGIGGGLLFFVFVNTMPAAPPATFSEYWSWAREALQTLTPAKYHAVPPNPTTPAAPAQEKTK